MPLIHNDSPASQSSAANSFQSTFAASLSAVKTVRDVDEQVKNEALAEARKVLTQEIASKLESTASDIRAEKRPASGIVSFNQLAMGRSIVPENSTLLQEQFKSRSSDNLTSLLRKYPELIDSQVLGPIAKELEEAGFANVKLQRGTHTYPGCHPQPMIHLSLELPKP